MCSLDGSRKAVVHMYNLLMSVPGREALCTGLEALEDGWVGGYMSTVGLWQGRNALDD